MSERNPGIKFELINNNNNKKSPSSRAKVSYSFISIEVLKKKKIVKGLAEVARQ